MKLQQKEVHGFVVAPDRLLRNKHYAEKIIAPKLGFQYVMKQVSLIGSSSHQEAQSALREKELTWKVMHGSHVGTCQDSPSDKPKG